MKKLALAAASIISVAVLAGTLSAAQGGTTRVGKAPLPCRAAIYQARVIAGYASQGFGIAASISRLVYKAAVAGANSDTAEIDAIAAELKGDSTRLNDLAKKTTRHATIFNNDAAGCQ